jgi:putative transcriptional regulator
VKISYKPLMRQLLERDMGKMDLLRVADISTTTLSKLSKNQPVKLEMLMKICYVRNRSLNQVLFYFAYLAQVQTLLAVLKDRCNNRPFRVKYNTH